MMHDAQLAGVLAGLTFLGVFLAVFVNGLTLWAARAPDTPGFRWRRPRL